MATARIFSIDAEENTDVLEPHLFQGKCCVFQQDNADPPAASARTQSPGAELTSLQSRILTNYKTKNMWRIIKISNFFFKLGVEELRKDYLLAGKQERSFTKAPIIMK